MTLERFLNVDELAGVLGVSTKHVYRRVREGCPSYRFGGTRRFLLSEVPQVTNVGGWPFQPTTILSGNTSQANYVQAASLLKGT